MLWATVEQYDQLRQLIQQLKIRSGLKPVFQNHDNNISEQSLANFIRSWNHQYVDSKLSTVKTQISDKVLKGTKILQDNILKD